MQNNKNIVPAWLDLAMASKIVTLFFGFIVILFFDQVLMLTESPYTLFFTLFTESMVFLSALSPFGTLSVLAADYLLDQGMYGYIVIGYIISLGANVLSFYTGILLSKQSAPTENLSKTKLLITFASPQLASLTAFESGLQKYSLFDYLKWVVPISAGWFFAASLMIKFFPADIRSPWVAYVGLVALLAWIALPFLKSAMKKTAPGV